MNNRAPRALRLAPMMVAPLSLLLLSAPLYAASTTVRRGLMPHVRSAPATGSV
mgnify:CR=1 FL=1